MGLLDLRGYAIQKHSYCGQD